MNYKNQNGHIKKNKYPQFVTTFIKYRIIAITRLLRENLSFCTTIFSEK